MKILILGASKTAQKKIIPSIKKIQDLEFDLASISANKKFGEKKRYFDYSEAIKNTRSEIVYISLISAFFDSRRGFSILSKMSLAIQYNGFSYKSSLTYRIFS